MPLNDLFEDPVRMRETSSDRAPEHEDAHFTSNSLPDSPSGREIGPTAKGIIRPEAKYPTNQKCLDENVFIAGNQLLPR